MVDIFKSGYRQKTSKRDDYAESFTHLMALTRRHFLKASVGLTGTSIPFFAGYRFGQQEKELIPEDISQAASQARIRLAGHGQQSAESSGSNHTEQGNGSPDTPCDVDIERTSIPREDIDTAFQGMARNSPVKFQRYRLDDVIQTTDRATIATLLDCDRTDWNGYTDDFYDCEEFAMDLRMSFIDNWGLNNVGIVYDRSSRPIPHVYNIVFYADRSFDLVEPQTDDVVSPGEADRYAFRDVAILL